MISKLSKNIFDKTAAVKRNRLRVLDVSQLGKVKISTNNPSHAVLYRNGNAISAPLQGGMMSISDGGFQEEILFKFKDLVA